MKKNWIIGALMSVILLCATDVVAQNAKQEDARAVIDETYTLICLQCNVKQPTSYMVHGDNLTEEDKKNGVSMKWIHLCPKCSGAWYTTDKNQKNPVPMPREEAVRLAKLSVHVCSDLLGCLEEKSVRMDNGYTKHTMKRTCVMETPLKVKVVIGNEQRIYTLSGKTKTIEFESRYGGAIPCKYPYNGPSAAKKPTTQGPNGKRKSRVMLRGER